MNEEITNHLGLTDFSKLPTSATLTTSSTVSPWPTKLPFDMAMGESDERLCQLHNISQDALDRLKFHPQFRREVAVIEKDVRENGVTFKRKARVQAEMYLEDLHRIITNIDTPASVKVDAIKSIVKWGDLEPEKLPQNSAFSQNNMKIEIAWLAPTPPPSEGSMNNQPQPLINITPSSDTTP